MYCHILKSYYNIIRRLELSMDKRFLKIFDDVQEIARQNYDLLKVLQGYCESKFDGVCEPSVMLTAVKLIRSNQKRLLDKIDKDSTELYHEILTKEAEA